MTEPRPLDIYLNDHLAGGTGGIEAAAHAAEEHAGTPLGEFLRGLSSDIEQDHRTLKEIMERVGAVENPIKQAGAKVMEKISRFKLSGARHAELATLLTLETLALGIRGKLYLWQALKEATGSGGGLSSLDLSSFDFDHLIARAEEQLAGLERERIVVAKAALRVPAGV